MRELEFPRERTGVSPLGNWVWPNDGMDGVRMRSFVVRFVFVSDTACPYVRFVFSPFRFCSSLRSLREVCLRAVMIFLHADYAESAEFYLLTCFTLALEGSQTSLRLRFHHTPSPFGYSPCLRGRKEDGNISSNFVPLR